MKKIYLLSLICLWFIFFGNKVFGQVNIFPVETMGTVASNTAISAHTGWVNNATLAFGAGVSPADVRNTGNSTGYSGASGGANVFFTNTAAPRTFIISGINTSSYSSITLSFGVFKSTTNLITSSIFAVEVSTDGTSYSPLSYTDLPSGGGTAIWFLRTATGTIPSTSNLRIRFSNTTTANQIRLDDVQLQGILVASNTISAPSTPSTINLANCTATQDINVNVTSTGTFTAGNQYTAQLSDASGSFVSPIAATTISDNTNTPPTITLTVPAGTVTGIGYKVRVISNNPSTIGGESGAFTINQGGTCVSNASDYFRSKQTGNWNLTSTWESSADNISWINATLVPDNNANTILIRNSHVVTINTNTNIDQTIIQSGGTLIHASNAINIQDGAGDDLTIEGGGIFESQSTLASFAGSATLRVKANGKISSTTGNQGLRYVASPLSSPADVTANVIWESNAIYEHAQNNVFSSSGITFFPNVTVEIPVFRISQNVGAVGAGTNTTFNGIFEANGNITWQNTGVKTFRNGIRGTGTITQNASAGKFAITGTTAELSGVILVLDAVNGLTLENNGVVNVNNNLTLNSGKIVFTNADLNLNNRNLTINGGTLQENLPNNYTIVDNTATTEAIKGGAVIYNATVTGVATNFFNAGLSLNHGGTGDYAISVSRRHYSGGFGQGIKRIYQITGTPSGTSAMTIRYAESELGTVAEPLSISRWQPATGWQSYTPDVVDFVNNIVTYNNVTAFSDWTLSSQTNALPIQLVSFFGEKIQKNTAKISWKTATETNNAYFVLEKSENQTENTGKNVENNFIKIAQIDAQGNTTTLKNYSFVDDFFSTSAYYRLSQVDENGTKTQVGLFFLKNEEKISIEIYPNPIQENIYLKGENNQIYTLNIQNSEGKNVFSAKGNLEFLQKEIQNNIQTLQKGMYLFVFQNENKKVIKKVIK